MHKKLCWASKKKGQKFEKRNKAKKSAPLTFFVIPTSRIFLPHVWIHIFLQFSVHSPQALLNSFRVDVGTLKSLEMKNWFEFIIRILCPRYILAQAFRPGTFWPLDHPGNLDSPLENKCNEATAVYKMLTNAKKSTQGVACTWTKYTGGKTLWGWNAADEMSAMSRFHMINHGFQIFIWESG